MIKTLIDYKTKEKFRIVTSGNKYLPCFGEDGIMYLWLTNLFYDGNSYPREDCRILDFDQKIGLYPMKTADRQSVIRWDGEESKFKSFEDIENYITKL